MCIRDRAFPVGALMSLNTGGPVDFKPRPIEGAPIEAKNVVPQSLLLDGQQRMTSLYQVTLYGRVVETVTPKKKKVKHWFYIDIRKALDPSIDREAVSYTHLSLDSGPRPNVAGALNRGFHRRDVLFLGRAKCPDFIALNFLAR